MQPSQTWKNSKRAISFFYKKIKKTKENLKKIKIQSAYGWTMHIWGQKKKNERRFIIKKRKWNEEINDTFKEAIKVIHQSETVYIK